MFSEVVSFSILGRTVTIYFYGLFLLIAIIAGVIILYRELKRRNLETKRILDNIAWILLLGIIGARLGYAFLYYNFFIEHPGEIFMFWRGGLVFSGGFLFGLLTVLIWLYYRNRKELWGWLDSIMIATALGHGIGMLGSFFSGIDYGRPTNLPWGVKFPVLGDNVVRHPTQLYEFISYLIVFVALLIISERIVKNKEKVKHIFPGFIFFFGILSSFFIRFAVEFFRESEKILFDVGTIDISSTHITSLVLLMLGITGLVWRERNIKNNK